jgi:hypothetical protein
MWKPAGIAIVLCVAFLMGAIALANPAVAHPSEPSLTTGFAPVGPVIGHHASTGAGTHCPNGAGCTFIILNGGSIRPLSETSPYVRAARSGSRAGLCVPPAAPPPKFAA